MNRTPDDDPPRSGGLPPHHRPGGGFRTPWERPGDRPDSGDMRKFLWQQISGSHSPSPKPDQVPQGETRLAGGDTPMDEMRVTFVGHATFLIQWGGINILTDPHFSKRASPLSWAGPKRFSPPGLAVEELPPIHAVVLSHDHYDHLDETSVKALHARFGSELTWVTPLGYREWFAQYGIENLRELDWWTATELADLPGAPGASVSVEALPAQHWTRRGRHTNARLWASYVLRFRSAQRPGNGSAASHDLYFGGDSGYFEGYKELGQRAGPFDTLLLPIGAYEPRWFMRYSHMNPEDALQAYRDLGEQGVCIGMHWGVFRLTFEDPLEPPVRMRSVWQDAGLPDEDLHTPGIGGTVVVVPSRSEPNSTGS